MHSPHVLSLRQVLSLRGDKTCRKVHSLHVLRHSFASGTIICLSLPSLCVCVCVCARARLFVYARAQVCLRARTCLCVCVCVCVLMCVCPWQRARARECVVVYCVVFITSASISAKLKFCIALSRLRGYCCP